MFVTVLTAGRRRFCCSSKPSLQANLLEKVKNGLDLPKDASNREEVFQEIKDKTTAWVAKYRRGGAFQGRPSYRYVHLAAICPGSTFA